ncbi:MAG: rRNA maturation RNase YbeY [Bdellovibrionales bacterium]|jgi:probable rRNA maturation factor|nr:rRNA maturation RNase YbeY [Bdellovibrionales bacterium]
MRNILIRSKNIDLVCSDTSKSSNPFYHKKRLDQYLLQILTHLEKGLIRELNATKNKKLSISLLICGKHKIKKLNKLHRKKDKITDVLSFPQYENLRKGPRKDEFNPTGELHVGDIVICKEVALKQSKELEHSLEQEIVALFLHGFLHLLGYDHEKSTKEEKVMFGLEDKVIKKMKWNK